MQHARLREGPLVHAQARTWKNRAGAPRWPPCPRPSRARTRPVPPHGRAQGGRRGPRLHAPPACLASSRLSEPDADRAENLALPAPCPRPRCPQSLRSSRSCRKGTVTAPHLRASNGRNPSIQARSGQGSEAPFFGAASREAAHAWIETAQAGGGTRVGLGSRRGASRPSGGSKLPAPTDADAQARRWRRPARLASLLRAWSRACLGFVRL